MGGILNPGKKLAKQMAASAKETATTQAANDRIMAQAAQQTRETAIAQDKASQAAAALLNQPVEAVDVQVGEDVPQAEIDPNTGRRRTTRSSFQMARKTSGLNIS